MDISLGFYDAIGANNTLFQSFANTMIGDMSEFTTYIVTNFHMPLRNDLFQVSRMLLKLNMIYPDKTLLNLSLLFDSLKKHLIHHLDKEESVVFPFCEGKFSAHQFGNIDNPLEVMLAEHDTETKALDEIGQLTNNFTTPKNAKFEDLYKLLAKIDKELREHMSIENQVFTLLANQVNKGKFGERKKPD